MNIIQASHRTLFNGLVELSNVTNSYGGFFTSGGIAYNLELPWEPDKFEWYRYTAFGTAGTLSSGVWYRGMPAASDLITRSIADSGVSGLTSQLLATTNGVTYVYTPPGFAVQQLVITNISTGSPAVVTTSVDHNLSDYDRVVITKVIGTMAAQINNHQYSIRALSPTTFSLYDFHGFPISVVGAYTSSGEVTKNGPRLGDVAEPSTYPAPERAIQNYPARHQLTLGTSVMGAVSDVIYFTAWQFNTYQNFGTLPTS